MALIDDHIIDARANHNKYKAYFRHQHSNYEDLLAQVDDGDISYEKARTEWVGHSDRPATWPEFLNRYDLRGETAEGIASVLRSPAECHPCWLKEAILAVDYLEIDPDGLTHETISEAIKEFRLAYDREFEHRQKLCRLGFPDGVDRILFFNFVQGMGTAEYVLSKASLTVSIDEDYRIAYAYNDDVDEADRFADPSDYAGRGDASEGTYSGDEIIALWFPGGEGQDRIPLPSREEWAAAMEAFAG
jgi:hypothetical protein